MKNEYNMNSFSPLHLFCQIIFELKISSMNWQTQEEVLVEVLQDETEDLGHGLVVFNDDVNTFDHVIETLVKVCKHERVQAEQCTYIIHFKGKCEVKKGSMIKLNPMKDAILDRGINAAIV